MAKRVGSSHEPEKRKKAWLLKKPSLRNWTIIRTGLTYDEAKAVETYYVKKYGYEGSPGGPRLRGPVYSVYTFTY